MSGKDSWHHFLDDAGDAYAARRAKPNGPCALSTISKCAGWWR